MSKTLTQWESYIGNSLKKTAESTLETAKRIALFKQDQSKEDFTRSMSEWFGFTPTHISYWTKINDNMERFQDNVECIPSSTRTLYELSSIDDELWNEIIDSGDIKPSLTVESAKNLKLSGGIVKGLSAKYSEAYNYLEISNILKKIKSETDTVVELKQVFKEWLKLNPPDWREENNPEEPIEAEYEEVVEPIKSNKMTRQDAYALFGIHMDKKITDLDILRVLNQLADTDELNDALEVIRK